MGKALDRAAIEGAAHSGRGDAEVINHLDSIRACERLVDTQQKALHLAGSQLLRGWGASDLVCAYVPVHRCANVLACLLCTCLWCTCLCLSALHMHVGVSTGAWDPVCATCLHILCVCHGVCLYVLVCTKRCCVSSCVDVSVNVFLPVYPGMNVYDCSRHRPDEKGVRVSQSQANPTLSSSTSPGGTTPHVSLI